MTNQQKVFATFAVAGALMLGQRVDTQQAGAAQTSRPTAAAAPWGSSGEIHDFPVQGNVHLLVGAGGNIAVQVGDEGVLVVDTGMGQYSERVLAAIRRLSDKPIRYIVNTHFHADHTGGNEVIGKAGTTVRGDPTAIVAYETVLARMGATIGEKLFAPSSAWPTATYVTGQKDFFFNGEPVLVQHPADGHTDGDSIVVFRRSDVIVAGDIFITTGFPVIDRTDGGSVDGVIDGLNRILDIAVPKHEQEGGTYVIPGHGRIGDEADVLEYRDIVTIVRDRIKDMVERGLTLEQVKAARPTVDFDLQYGSTTGPWTTAMFIEAVFRDVSAETGRKGSL